MASAGSHAAATVSTRGWKKNSHAATMAPITPIVPIPATAQRTGNPGAGTRGRPPPPPRPGRRAPAARRGGGGEGGRGGGPRAPPPAPAPRAGGGGGGGEGTRC